MTETQQQPQVVKKAMPTFWDKMMDDVEQGRQLTEDEVVDYYDAWAKDGSYESSVAKHGYGALDVLEKTINGLFPGNKQDLVVLDVGACTGFAGQRLHQMGFRTIDALDPSAESLNVAKEKGAYRNFFNVYMSSEPLDIPADSYDAIVVVGAMGPKHLPLDAFTEMIRLVKPGGYIVNLVREEYFDRCQDYVKKWTPAVEAHVKAGRWQQIEEEHYEEHFNGRGGYKQVWRVC